MPAKYRGGPGNASGPLHPRAGLAILAAHSHPGQLAVRARPWSPADDQLVLTLPPAEAARRLGRSLPAVYIRRAKLRPGNGRRPWTPAEDRLLMRLPADVAVRYLKRPRAAIDQRRRKLGLLKDPAPIPR
jgi:hypothetical protein